MSVVINSYSNSNSDNFGGVSYSEMGQAFTVTDSTYENISATFYMGKTGSPTGNYFYRLYAVTGAMGSSAVPSTLLATSPAGNIASLTASLVATSLSFTGLTLPPGNYAVTVSYAGGDGSNYLAVGIDTSSPSHPGNLVLKFDAEGIWGAFSTYDVPFSVSGDVYVPSSNFLPFFA